MVQFWQCLQRNVQPKVNMVPEGTSSGSSPMCSNMVETVIFVPHLHQPSSPLSLLTPHLRLQKWHFSRIRLAISIFKSRYDFSGVSNSSRLVWRASICFSSWQYSSVSLSWSAHSLCVGSSRLKLAGIFLAIRNLAGF